MLHFPPEYKAKMMRLLFKYQDSRNEEERNSGERRNVGWKRLAREILVGCGRTPSDEAVKALKNAIEANQFGKSTIKDNHFEPIERFLLELDARGGMDALRREALAEKRSFQRSAFADFLGRDNAPESIQSALKAAHGASYLFDARGIWGGEFEVIVRFTNVSSEALDVTMYICSQPFSRLVDSRTIAGLAAVSGFATLGRVRNYPYADLADSQLSINPYSLIIDGTALLPNAPALVGSIFMSVGFNFRIWGSRVHPDFPTQLSIKSIELPTEVRGPWGKDFGLPFDEGSNSPMLSMNIFSSAQIIEQSQVDYLEMIAAKFDAGFKNG